MPLQQKFVTTSESHAVGDSGDIMSNHVMPSHRGAMSAHVQATSTAEVRAPSAPRRRQCYSPAAQALLTLDSIN